MLKTESLPVCGRFDDEGLSYLESRFLDAGRAKEMRISAYDGMVYFPFSVNGKIVAWKSRSISDKKDQKVIYVDKEKEAQADKPKLPFFNMLQPNNTKYLIITEGEFDCLAGKQLGGENVVSLPNGSASVESSFRNNYEFLQKFETIYIAFDMDGPGDKAAAKAMEMLPANKYRRIIFPENEDTGKPYKDLNEWVIAKNPRSEDLATLLINAQRVECSSITSFSDLSDEWAKAVDMGVKTGFFKLDNILGGYRIGELTTISAETGSGKSTFVLNIAHQLTKHGKKVWINSYEMSLVAIQRKMAGIVLGKRIGWNEVGERDRLEFQKWALQDLCYINTDNKKVDLKGLRKEFEIARLGYGVEYVILDHLDYLYDKSTNQWANLEATMQGIHELALEFKVGVFLVAHPKQIQGPVREVTYNDLKGGSCIRQFSDNILILTRLDNLDPEKKNKTKVTIAKNRLMGRQAYFELEFDPLSNTFFEDQKFPSQILTYKDEEDYFKVGF